MEQSAKRTEEAAFSHAITLDHVDLYCLRASGGVSPSMALGVMPTRPALLIAVTDTHGCTGWGEVWANFPPRANLHKSHLIEDVVIPKLTGLTFTDPREVATFLRDTLSVYFLHIGQEQVLEHILAGLDTALWDLALRSAGRSFAEHLGIDGAAMSYASSINPDDLEDKLASHSRCGQTHFKLKLGFGDNQDCSFVERAAKNCPDGARIMVDSNQRWNLAQAKSMLSRLAPFDPFFSEEPMPANASLKEWEALARSTDVPLASGENVYGVDRFIALANSGLRFLQPDVAKWGGVSGALELAEVAPAGIRIWPHFMGTAVGQVAALCVAAAVGASSACEMDVNKNPLRSHLCGDILQIRDGQIALPTDPGLVIPPHPENLAKYHDKFL